MIHDKETLISFLNKLKGDGVLITVVYEKRYHDPEGQEPTIVVLKEQFYPLTDISKLIFDMVSSRYTLDGQQILSSKYIGIYASYSSLNVNKANVKVAADINGYLSRYVTSRECSLFENIPRAMDDAVRHPTSNDIESMPRADLLFNKSLLETASFHYYHLIATGTITLPQIRDFLIGVRQQYNDPIDYIVVSTADSARILMSPKGSGELEKRTRLKNVIDSLSQSLSESQNGYSIVLSSDNLIALPGTYQGGFEVTVVPDSAIFPQKYHT